MSANLYEIAPTIALARAQWNWTHASADDPGIGIQKGQEWAEIVSWEQLIEPCWRDDCSGKVDRSRFRRRVLVGPNTGHIGNCDVRQCRKCRYGWSQFR